MGRAPLSALGVQMLRRPEGRAEHPVLVVAVRSPGGSSAGRTRTSVANCSVPCRGPRPQARLGDASGAPKWLTTSRDSRVRAAQSPSRSTRVTSNVCSLAVAHDDDGDVVARLVVADRGDHAGAAVDRRVVDGDRRRRRPRCRPPSAGESVVDARDQGALAAVGALVRARRRGSPRRGPRRPRTPRRSVEHLATSSAEMAKPTLVAAVAMSLRATAVLMPTMRPAASTSGPPELPEEIAASVWISPSSAPSSVMIVRSSADTMPSVTVGSPSRSRANPMASDLVAEPDLGGRGERHRREVVAVDAQQGEVVAGVGRHERRPRSARSRRAGGRGSRSPRSTTWALVRISPSADSDDAGADGPPADEVGADRDDRRPDGVDDGPDRRAACRRRSDDDRRPGAARAGSPRSHVVVVARRPDEHADEPGHERRGADRERRRPAAGAGGRPGGLGGRALTPGAGGGSTGIRFHLPYQAAPRHQDISSGTCREEGGARPACASDGG